MLKPSVVAAVVLLIPQIAQAQPALDVGSQIQQIPPPPTLENPVPEIRVERRALQPDDDPVGAGIRVRSLNLTGQTIFTEGQLLAVTGFTPGEFSLRQLRQLAAKITAHYNERGYFLAQAYLPAQDIREGQVAIAVIEGRYSKVDLRNRSTLRDGVARGVLNGLDGGDIVTTAPLERRLLLLSDIPGIAVRSTLSPGETVGTSTLAVEIDPTRRINGSVEADNGGNHFTGALRFGGSLNLNNPTGRGDLLSVRALGSTSGLAYGRAAYQTLVGNSTIGVAYSHIKYDIGREFKSLDADGSADVFSLFGRHPLIRSRRANLYALAAVEAKFFTDRLGVASTKSHRRAQVVTLGVNGDSLDHYAGGGSNVYAFGASFGELDIRDSADRLIDHATARSDGSYAKFQASFARVQNVAGPVSVYGAIRGQFALENLDSSEKMHLGGPYGVRAFPEGEAYGDEGFVANLEARYLLPPFAVPGRIQLIAFIDGGVVRYAQDPWFSGSNTARRSGIGAGLNWIAPNNFIFQTTYAHKLNGQRSTTYDDGSGRFWFRVAKFF